MYAPVEMQKAKESQSPFFIELYILELRTGISYIAACDEDVEFNGNTFVAVPFSRDDITRSADNLFDETSVTLGDVDDSKLAYVLSGFDFRGCKVAIFKIQYPDSLKNPKLVLPMFIGYLDSPSYSNGVFSCALRSMFPTSQVPRREFQLQCNSDYGDDNCRMGFATTEATVTAVSGNWLTLNKSFSNDFYKYGMATVLGESRNILESNGNRVRVGINFLQDRLIGKTIVLQRGCDKTKECCGRMGNLVHFSGFPAVPFESVYR